MSKTKQARAQSALLEPNSGPGVQLEALRPNARDLDISTASFTFYLSGCFTVGRENHLREELPFVHYEEDYSYPPLGNLGPESVMGNPYLGLRTEKVHLGFSFTVGPRLNVDETFEGFSNDLFKNIMEYKLNLEASFFF